MLLNKENKKFLAQERGARLRLARQMSGMTRIAMARKYNINIGHLSCWESGKTMLGYDTAQFLSKIFAELNMDITADWLLSGNTEEVSVLVNNKVIKNCSNSDTTKAVNTNISIIDEVNFFKNNQPNSEVIIINDSALAPFFRVGDYAGGIYTTDATFFSLIGKICIIASENQDLIARKIFKYCGDGLFVIGAINPLEIQEPISKSRILKAAAITRHWMLEEHN